MRRDNTWKKIKFKKKKNMTSYRFKFFYNELQFHDAFAYTVDRRSSTGDSSMR